MKPADRARARAAALEVLESFGVNGPPVPIERMIKARGIVLQHAPLDESLSGMAFIRDGVGIIGVNALHHPNRQRFSAAHELAHHILHEEEIRRAVHVDKEFRVFRRDDVASMGTDPFEIEANTFAAELLMPLKFLKEAVEDIGLDVDDDREVEALAKKFRVSPSAMRFRLGGVI